MSGDKMVAVAVNYDALMGAAANLPKLADMLGAYYEKMNFDGEGKRDAEDVKRDVLTGARACVILLNAIDGGEKKHGKH